MQKPDPDLSVTPANRVEKARQFYTEATDPDREKTSRQSSWGQLWILKQKAKYGWDKLGFDSREIERIKLNKPDWV
jgi:hypothetical protein